MTPILLSTGLGLALLGCVVLGTLWLRARKTPAKKLDVTANDLLHDLTGRGSAVLRVEVLDPEALLYRRP